MLNPTLRPSPKPPEQRTAASAQQRAVSCGGNSTTPAGLQSPVEVDVVVLPGFCL